MTHNAPPEATTGHQKRPFFAHMLRILAVPIVLFWVFVAVVVNVIAPQLEVVGELHSAPMAPEDAPSMKAMKLMGGNFKEFDSAEWTDPKALRMNGEYIKNEPLDRLLPLVEAELREASLWSDDYAEDGSRREWFASTVELLRAANPGVAYTRHEIAGYGHIDCIFGKDAARDVFPYIVDGLV